MGSSVTETQEDVYGDSSRDAGWVIEAMQMGNKGRR